MPDILLGLIGDNIAASRAPAFHELAGLLAGLDVRYERLVPHEIGVDFDRVLADCPARGYRGVNITYPYKERAAAKVRVDDPLIRRLGAVNTVIFDAEGPRGANTDHTGFVAAYLHIRGAAAPGPVCMIGAGGVGKAVGFGLLQLGLREIRVVERDLAKAEALADSLRSAEPGLAVVVTGDAVAGAAGASGLINCTPVGMVGYGGTPLPQAAMRGATWAFDAVYTPLETVFLKDAAAEGLAIIPGYELFFHQGVDAWALFTGRPLDKSALRAGLAKL
ncbi:shikimate dehydrogenase [Pikeienuella piscinae]|uniref:Shikimate dehydrogenase n=1 Tax=Pikeienuella piscinae TaxID=2748098 RepID=A0A7L5BUH8_9RHOB|nr:shikimate dehydrogenase [Pikeienuella piscinae]QIE54643.1 shikimate dehydrogenase [Pikeienuella piscinae]